jgi:hypothetical protein
MKTLKIVLIAAMYHQIDKDVILNSPSHVHIASVIYQGTVYRINGTLDQWVRFFRFQGVGPVNTRKGININ